MTNHVFRYCHRNVLLAVVNAKRHPNKLWQDRRAPAPGPGARLGFDYWFHESYFLEAASNWERQMYTEHPWQITSYFAVGWQKSILSWFWFSPKLGIGSVNARWTSGTGDMFINDFSVFASADLRYRKPYTFIREAEISGNVYFPPDNPENFIDRKSVV